MKADLHIHTTESDGCLSVEEVVKIASEHGIKTLAITDHDTTAGVDQAIEIGRNFGITVIPGVEIFTTYKQEEIHLLGYYKDIHNHSLQQRLKQIREERTILTEQMVQNLKKNGITINWQEVQQQASHDGVVCKTHIMYAIQNRIDSAKEIDWNYIASWFKPGGIAYIPYDVNTFHETVDLIYQTGGIPVLAHPGLIRNQGIISELMNYRPIGLEVYYAYWDNMVHTVAEFELLAEKMAILSTGGSDYHGFYSPVGIGKMTIPEKCVIDLTNYLKLTY